jgi:hypothetical protein
MLLYIGRLSFYYGLRFDLYVEFIKLGHSREWLTLVLYLTNPMNGKKKKTTTITITTTPTILTTTPTTSTTKPTKPRTIRHTVTSSVVGNR